MRTRCRFGIAGIIGLPALAGAFVCAAVLGCDAQDAPRVAAGAQVTPATAAQAPMPNGTAAAADTSVRNAGGPHTPPAGPPSEFPMNPDAKWACDQQTVVLNPVWRGQERLSFTFLIRNEGTADLQIRAKGG